MQITHNDMFRGRVTVHVGSSDERPPLYLGRGRYVWPDGDNDAGIIDWGDRTSEMPIIKVSGETPQRER